MLKALETFLLNLAVAAVIALGLELGVPYEITHTCYEGLRPSCGRCDACTERIEAFMANKARDPLDYCIDISWPS